MSSSPPKPRHAYVEEYNEEAHTTLPETRQTANVAAKRSSKPEISKLKVPEAGRDGASDSGYSSQAANSSQDSKAAATPLKVEEQAVAPTIVPVDVEPRSKNRQRSPQKQPKPPLLQRSASKAQKKEPVRRDQELCNCAECIASGRIPASAAHPPQPSNLYSNARQPRPRHEAPPSPQALRHPSTYPTQEVPILQPAQPRPRASTSQTYHSSRPASFHAGMMMEQPLLQPVYLERRPPTAYTNAPQFPPPSYPPPNINYPPSPLATAPQRQIVYPHPSASYDIQPRPTIRHYPSEQYPSTSRRSSMYGAPPIVEHSPLQPLYAVPPTQQNVQPVPRRPSSYRLERPSPISPPSEDYHGQARTEDFYLMPPPPPPPPPTASSSQQRPPIRHAATTSAAQPILQHRRSVREAEEKVLEKSSRKQSIDEARPTSHRPSLALRPSGTQNASSSSDTKKNSSSSIHIEPKSAAPPPPTLRRRRPVTYYGHETPRELEKEAEAYQAAQRSKSENVRPEAPTIDSVHQLVRRKTKTHSSGGSETGSRASKEGSDLNSKHSSRTAVDKRVRGGSDVKIRKEEAGDDGFTMRFDATQGVKFDLKGDSVEGRIISLRQSREGVGEMELSIGGKQVAATTATTTTTTRGREEARDRSVRTYSYMGSEKGVKQIEFMRSQSRVGRDGVSERIVETERRMPGVTETIVETERQRGGLRGGVRDV
ncbi:hypothetical protein MMC06_000883, partial [Schaereria dolodes]|nr:hypothetical protein [Schaereria dolodes]